jgi:hypothetical protein
VTLACYDALGLTLWTRLAGLRIPAMVTGDSGEIPKSVTMRRNPRSRSTGIDGHVAPEYPQDGETRGLKATKPIYTRFPALIVTCFQEERVCSITRFPRSSLEIIAPPDEWREGRIVK